MPRLDAFQLKSLSCEPALPLLDAPDAFSGVLDIRGQANDALGQLCGEERRWGRRLRRLRLYRGRRN